MADRHPRIADHGVIGDLRTAALISNSGAINHFCWPDLDSPSVFAALLDAENGGSFAIEPQLDDARRIQLYVPDTNVLVTRWMAESGSAEITDLMPHPEPGDDRGVAPRCVIRRVTATTGTVSFKAVCDPRFDYARKPSTLSTVPAGLLFSGGDIRLLLASSVPLVAEGTAGRAEFTLEAGESAWFVLGGDDVEGVDEGRVTEEIAKTIAAWRNWSRRSTYRGRWREAVARSALALKLLTSARHGSIAAAATFSLPEAIGAGRNWDYRATWIRDASFTVYAFMRLGFTEEAERFRAWAADRMAETDPGHPLRIMYALDGSKASDEQELPHLTGYADSRPVRIGNAAHQQTQLDIFGELLDSVYLSNKYGAAISHEGWLHVCEIVKYVLDHWNEADAGIWEMRAEPRHFLHSRLMCWVALDRAIRLANKRSLPAPLVHWAEVRDEIAADIWSNFRHPTEGHFVQSRGSTELDGAILMMPLVRFVSATDPVWLRTLDAIGEQLRDDGLVYRYRGDDGLEGREGAFTTCTFWYAECLARAGRLEEAEMIMAKGIAYATPLGLFSEEVDRRGLALGNFPQALTHLSFVSAAFFLDRVLHPDHRPNWQP